MNSKETRDFLLEEIRKKIVGPGYAQDIFVCKPDASDEIITDRPNMVYVSGTLFPQTIVKTGADYSAQVQSPVSPLKDDNADFFEEMSVEDEDSMLLPGSYEDNGNEIVEDADQEIEDKKVTIEEVEDGNNDPEVEVEDSDTIDTSLQHQPYNIGLITCLRQETKEINVVVKYGQYHEVPAKDLCKEVKVRIGRCNIELIRRRFEEYNTSAKEVLACLDCRRMDELFRINEDETISPLRHCVYEEQKNGRNQEHWIKPKEFPATLRNKVAKILLDLIQKSPNNIQLKKITWEQIESQLNIFNNIPEVKEIIIKQGWAKSGTLQDGLSYNQNENSISLNKKSKFEETDIQVLKAKLYEDDPIRDELLEHLLFEHFFKREANEEQCTINFDSSDKKIKLNNDCFLLWKIIDVDAKRYVQIQLLNANERKLGLNGNRGKTSTSAYLMQSTIEIHSDNIIPYSSPHSSSVEDEEYTLNERLYQDEYVYGKGVNCAATWDSSESPKWIKTTYSPNRDVRAYATTFDDKKEYLKEVNKACCIHDLSIWSQIRKDEIISRLSAMADAYNTWMDEQKIKAGSDQLLKKITINQNDFHERLVDNISYLRDNDRAWRCFQIANTAMLIQMLLSRDPKFKSHRTLSELQDLGNFFSEEEWNYFKECQYIRNNVAQPYYYPFQLAFLLMNIKSTFENTDPYRNDSVDLIWFPTGGGKTEAYLALTALTIAERRTSDNAEVDGVSVIMRYTLRLLATQQFERASYLICALEYLRNQLSSSHEYSDYKMKGGIISIGLWVGSSATPNDINTLTPPTHTPNKYSKFYREITEGKEPEKNPFPISCCPWCGCNMVVRKKVNGNEIIQSGYSTTGALKCNNNSCRYETGLPIAYIDDIIYQNPPTLLFATVDKFAQLARSRTVSLFSSPRKPDLIIEDELHLISGPLGSMVGLFETMVEAISTTTERRPKIIASTATTRNTKHLVNQLYNREVISFPASGVRYDDNFFSHVLKIEDSRRRYMAFIPTGHTAAELEIQTIAATLVAREKLILQKLENMQVDMMNAAAVYKELVTTDNYSLKADLDAFWSVVLYYNNVKSLGRAKSRIAQEVLTEVGTMRRYMLSYPSLSFILDNFHIRITELTGRKDSGQIKQILTEAESPIQLQLNNDEINVKSAHMDIIQATNMISVGIDVARWNLMLMIGQPLTTAEFIQSSSRVGRNIKNNALVISLYNPVRNRELSLFENYEAYLQMYYKFVEPLSVTSFTEMTIQNLISNIYMAYMIQIAERQRPREVTQIDLQGLFDLIRNRSNDLNVGTNLYNLIVSKVQDLHAYMITNYLNSTFSQIWERLQDNHEYEPMQSLRDVESNTYLVLEQ